MVDMVVPRTQMRATLARLCRMLTKTPAVTADARHECARLAGLQESRLERTGRDLAAIGAASSPPARSVARAHRAPARRSRLAAATLPPVIHVAGTNGKGSTVAFMRAILEAAGKRVHVDTSPHLVRFNERIRLAGKLVDDATLEATLDECERVNAGQSISIFEITTAAAFLLFSQIPGRLSAGRSRPRRAVRRHQCHRRARSPAVITPISIDHPEFLGATVDKIAFEKAGILQAGRARRSSPSSRKRRCA